MAGSRRNTRGLGRQIYNAVLTDNAERIRELAARDPTALDYSVDYLGDEPLLHCAADEGKRRAAAVLLELGRDVNEPRPHSYGVALSEAARHGHVDIMKLLLDAGALVDGHPSALTTPLCVAAIEGQLDAVKMLVDAGADIFWEGRRPATPLDWAVVFQVKKTGQEKVAEYLRSCGAIRPYSDWHNWEDPWVEFVERNIGVVHPHAIPRAVGKSFLSIYKARFAPKKSLHQLLFTTSIRPVVAAEISVAVPARWPLSRNALAEKRFAWPIDLLAHLGAKMLAGAEVAHGDVVKAEDELIRGFDMPVPEWVVVKHAEVEKKRKGKAGTVPLLVLTPVTTKKRYKPGKEALAEADKRAKYKWERIELPLPEMTPVGFEHMAKGGSKS